MGLAKAIKRGASALLIGSMMTGLFTGCSATGENSGVVTSWGLCFRDFRRNF